MCEICSMFNMFNFEHISPFSVSIVAFEQINVCLVGAQGKSAYNAR